jgi:hypothetical protein
MAVCAAGATWRRRPYVVETTQKKNRPNNLHLSKNPVLSVMRTVISRIIEGGRFLTEVFLPPEQNHSIRPNPPATSSFESPL